MANGQLGGVLRYIRQLVSTNWVRTVLWSIKFALVYWAYSLAPKP